MYGDTEFFRDTNNMVKMLLEDNAESSIRDRIKKIIEALQVDPKFNKIVKKFVFRTRNEGLIYGNENEIIKIIQKEGLKNLQSVPIEEIYNPLKNSLETILLDSSYNDEEKKRNKVIIIWVSAVTTIIILDNMRKIDDNKYMRKKYECKKNR